MLEHHAPYPGFVVDRWWNMVEANPPAQQLFLGGRSLADGAINMLDWIAEPEVRKLIINWDEALWAGIQRLRREADEAGGDSKLSELLSRALELADGVPQPAPEYIDSPVLCTRLRMPLPNGEVQELSVDHCPLWYLARDYLGRAAYRASLSRRRNHGPLLPRCRGDQELLATIGKTLVTIVGRNYWKLMMI